jgi:hypothetical protein
MLSSELPQDLLEPSTSIITNHFALDLSCPRSEQAQHCSPPFVIGHENRTAFVRYLPRRADPVENCRNPSKYEPIAYTNTYRTLTALQLFIWRKVTTQPERETCSKVHER